MRGFFGTARLTGRLGPSSSPRGGRVAYRIVVIVVGVIAAVSIGGLITTVVVGLAGDKYNAYGEVPIPGSGDITLPAGEVTVDFHVRNRGFWKQSGGLTVPPLHMNVVPPAGLPDPAVRGDLGGTVTLGDEMHRQVWVMQVAQAGTYRIETRGPVDDSGEPRLAFGRASKLEGPILVFAALSVFSIDLLAAVWWFGRLRRKAAATSRPAAPAPTGPYVPGDEGVRLEQLKTIAALRDSGALTVGEFEAEKRRILDGR